MNEHCAAGHAAVRHILTSPSIAERTAPYIKDADFDWAGIATELPALSSGQRVLVGIARDLWEAEDAVGVSDLARRLDDRSFARVVTALRIFRGAPEQEPAAALAA